MDQQQLGVQNLITDGRGHHSSRLSFLSSAQTLEVRGRGAFVYISVLVFVGQCIVCGYKLVYVCMYVDGLNKNERGVGVGVASLSNRVGCESFVCWLDAFSGSVWAIFWEWKTSVCWPVFQIASVSVLWLKTGVDRSISQKSAGAMMGNKRSLICISSRSSWEWLIHCSDRYQQIAPAFRELSLAVISELLSSSYSNSEW